MDTAAVEDVAVVSRERNFHFRFCWRVSFLYPPLFGTHTHCCGLTLLSWPLNPRLDSHCRLLCFNYYPPCIDATKEWWFKELIACWSGAHRHKWWVSVGSPTLLVSRVNGQSLCLSPLTRTAIPTNDKPALSKTDIYESPLLSGVSPIAVSEEQQ